ncbi:MAG: hypothetical protein JSV18_01575 [Candidatus Bathyarchaeota archaeon]|nr:MAG: hypothetical protein JSV18_01575 [Candidatus Bathyarchaeota archaeon]
MTLNIRGNQEELLSVFKGLLKEAGFFQIHVEESEKGFTIIGASAKRTSQLTTTILNIFIGYIHRNRIAIELTASQMGDIINATLKCDPYLDVLDMEAPDKDPKEQEKCLRTVNFFYDRIIERFELVS